MILFIHPGHPDLALVSLFPRARLSRLDQDRFRRTIDPNRPIILGRLTTAVLQGVVRALQHHVVNPQYDI